MRVQYDAWIKSSHHSAATCNDCHTPHNLVGKYAVKATNGFFHSFYFTSGKYPDNIQITRFDREVVESACRRCHEAILRCPLRVRRNDFEGYFVDGHQARTPRLMDGQDRFVFLCLAKEGVVIHLINAHTRLSAACVLI